LANPQGDWIFFTHEGGVDVGDVDAKAEKLLIPVDLSEYPSNAEFASTLLKKVPKGVHNVLIDFIARLYGVYVDSQFTYLEINPLVVIPNKDATSAEVHFLDLAAKLDQTAEFECGVKWAIARSNSALGLAAGPASSGKVSIDAGPPIEFPAPFGRELSKEEAYIAEMDAKTGASLKLTILNATGRVWTLVAGGGASVVYADAIASAGFASELANYGEYSGAPTETQTFHYARTVLDLMLRAPQRPEGKVLFIGGGIANFTNVASTFKGVIRALREVAPLLVEHKVQIWVRRAGPNYQEGLRNIKAVGGELGLSMHVSITCGVSGERERMSANVVNRCMDRICTFRVLCPWRSMASSLRLGSSAARLPTPQHLPREKSDEKREGRMTSLYIYSALDVVEGRQTNGQGKGKAWYSTEVEMCM
jgi:ATP citrate (pro-S)-lyase